MRRLPRLVTAAALVAIAAWLAARALDDGGAPAPRATPATARDVTAPGAAPVAALAVTPDPAHEQLPGVHCWDGLLALDRAATLDGLRAALARALASGDELLASYVADRLVELVGADAARALALLDWADAATGRELELVLGALARTEAVHAPAVSRRLLGVGADPTLDEGRRAAALTALDTQRSLPPEAIARLHAVALDPAAEGAAWTATRTLGRVMANDHARTGAYAPYWDTLLDVSRTTTDHAVRVLALEMPAYVDPVLGEGYIDDLAQLLTDAPEREVREMAAFQLGLTEAPDRVLTVFRAAFPREPELCVRWAIVRFAVRAAGARALPLLDDLARVDPRFAADVADFRRIYATGVHDFERVWSDKAEHHACGADEHPGDS